jgi:3-hydroxyisobutyrate dehydrogenase-like beta-hydroxyacid dehydrogenase
MAETSTKVGFVGLGHMAGNRAALPGRGLPAYGHERNRDRAQPLVDAGLHWCGTPRQVAEAGEIVFTSLPGDQVLEQAASGSDGIRARLSRGRAVDWHDVAVLVQRGCPSLLAVEIAR